MKVYQSKLVTSLVVTLSFLGSNAVWAGPKSVAIGTSHSLAVKSDGSAWGWGGNDLGQLGNSMQPPSPYAKVLLPVKADIANIISSTGPCYSTHVLKADGTVWSYGDNNAGVLGIGSSLAMTTTPMQVVTAPNNTPLNDVVAVASFAFHSVALKSNGTVWTWGQGSWGQLGDGTTTEHNSAVQVLVSSNTPLTNVIAIAAGNNVSYAIKGDGTVWAWGWNANFAMGVGATTTQSLWAMQVPGLTGITAVAVGYQNTVALKSDGTVWTWGRNTDGQLGDGSSLTATRSTPSMISRFTGVKRISSHWSTTLAVKGDGTLWAWGLNDSGQIGDGTTTNRTTPVKVSTLTGVEEIASGTAHSLAITHDDKAFAWGSNSFGELGNGTTNNSLFPIQVQGITP